MKTMMLIGFLQNLAGPELIIIFLVMTLPLLTLACLIHCGSNKKINGTEKGI